jgi:hypothetical protein
MKKLLLLLLLLPALAFGQELPDEDWLCTADDAWSLNRWEDRTDIVNKKEYAILDIKNNSEILLFNPSKGFKSVQDSFWSGSCSVSKLLPDTRITCNQVASTAVVDGISWSFIFDQKDNLFSYSDVRIESQKVYFGTCNQL